MKMKKLAACMLSMLTLLGILPTYASEPAPWRSFYVATNGFDTADGSETAPFKTLARAKEAVRAVSDNMQGNIVVNVSGGTYYMDSSLDFWAEDSGKNGHKIIWQGIDRPVLSGGQKIGGFQPSEGRPGVYETKVADADRIMQLYINGKKRYMARSNNFVIGQKSRATAVRQAGIRRIRTMRRVKNITGSIPKRFTLATVFTCLKKTSAFGRIPKIFYLSGSVTGKHRLHPLKKFYPTRTMTTK